MSAAIIQREGQSALVVTLASGAGQVYALPSLELAFESSIGSVQRILSSLLE